MDFNNNVTEEVINHEFDYSNAVPLVENISYLIKFCDNVFNQFMKMVDDDKKKNEKLKHEYKNYLYGESYNQKLEIGVRKGYDYISYKNCSSFLNAINNKEIVNLSSLEIKLNLNFERGQSGDTKTHENDFKISFEPYKIMFTRKSNFKDSEIDQIENNINELMKKLPTVNTIFCSK